MIWSGFIPGMAMEAIEVIGMVTGEACWDTTAGEVTEAVTGVTGLADDGVMVLVGDGAAELGSRTRVLCNSML